MPSQAVKLTLCSALLFAVLMLFSLLTTNVPKLMLTRPALGLSATGRLPDFYAVYMNTGTKPVDVQDWGGAFFGRFKLNFDGHEVEVCEPAFHAVRFNTAPKMNLHVLGPNQQILYPIFVRNLVLSDSLKQNGEWTNLIRDAHQQISVRAVGDWVTGVPVSNSLFIQKNELLN